MDRKWKTKGQFDGNVISSLLKTRGFSEGFLNPLEPESVLSEIDWSLGFNSKTSDIDFVVKLIKKHIDKGSLIFIHGDYDVDGICATAIMWKAIYQGLGYKNCQPFIPDRFEDGYGLSTESIDKIKLKSNGGLIVTVDCGITAVDACKYARDLGFDVIITDHHQKPELLPDANAILWSDQIVGSSVALSISIKLIGFQKEYLALAALATVSDIQALVNLNRSVVKYGLDALNEGASVGASQIAEIAGAGGKKLGTYELGWLIAPRLNAAGRLDSAMDALRLLCTSDIGKAREIASKLNDINAKRQQKTFENYEHARVKNFGDEKIILASDKSYHEGIIGLVAGRLVSEFYRPAVVISEGDELSKGSARSIEGVNIIELLRSIDMYESVGGHPLAAGFSIKSVRLGEFSEKLKEASKEISDELLKPVLKVDLELPTDVLSLDLVKDLSLFEPFGFGNSEPVFVSKGLKVIDYRLVGSKSDHIKLNLFDEKNSKKFDAIFFGGAKVKEKLNSGFIDCAFVLKENNYNGNSKLDLQIKDIKAL